MYTQRLLRLASRIEKANLKKLGEKPSLFVTNNPRDIILLIKNKPKFYRILYDTNLKLYFVGDGYEYIHINLLEEAQLQGYYLEEYDRGVYLEDFLREGIDNETLIPFTFTPLVSKVDEDMYDDNYAIKLYYPFGSLFFNLLTDWKNVDIVKLLGNPEKVRNLAAHY